MGEHADPKAEGFQEQHTGSQSRPWTQWSGTRNGYVNGVTLRAAVLPGEAQPARAFCCVSGLWKRLLRRSCAPWQRGRPLPRETKHAAKQHGPRSAEGSVARGLLTYTPEPNGRAGARPSGAEHPSAHGLCF